MDEIREECGVFGIGLFTSGKRNGFLAHRVYSGLLALQHRGQESAGIAVNEERVIRCHKGMGTVQEVFDEDTLQHMDQCSIAVGHVRYSTSGVSEPQNAQPLLVKHVKGQLAVCHNGNLVNSDKLRRELELSGCIFHTTSDTEVISYIITRCRLKTESIEEAVSLAMDQLKGAYSLVLMSPAKLIACRDENGFRPLVMGRREDGAIVFASETCALDAVGASFERELQPGEIVIADGEGVRSIWTHCGRKPEKLCLFEYILFQNRLPAAWIIGSAIPQGVRQMSGRRVPGRSGCRDRRPGFRTGCSSGFFRGEPDSIQLWIDPEQVCGEDLYCTGAGNQRTAGTDEAESGLICRKRKTGRISG